MDHERFRRVAHADPLCFGVDKDLYCHLQVGILVYVDMAVSGPGLYYRDLAVLHHCADESGSASGNQHVHILPHGHELSGRSPVGSGNELHGVRADPAFLKGIAKDLCDRDIGIDRIASAFKDHSAARLETQGKCVCRHVGTGFIDNADNAHGNTDLPDLHAVRSCEFFHDLSDRILKLCDLAQPLCDLFDPSLSQCQPVYERFRHACCSARFNILSVGLKNGRLSLNEFPGCRIQRLVLHPGAEFLNIIFYCRGRLAKICYNTHSLVLLVSHTVHQFL